MKFFYSKRDNTLQTANNNDNIISMSMKNIFLSIDDFY
jgi:hypothetical protein